MEVTSENRILFLPFFHPGKKGKLKGVYWLAAVEMSDSPLRVLFDSLSAIDVSKLIISRSLTHYRLVFDLSQNNSPYASTWINEYPLSYLEEWLLFVYWETGRVDVQK
jgi:hypothetical protein